MICVCSHRHYTQLFSSPSKIEAENSGARSLTETSKLVMRTICTLQPQQPNSTILYTKQEKNATSMWTRDPLGNNNQLSQMNRNANISCTLVYM
jgi:hypothetical protein